MIQNVRALAEQRGKISYIIENGKENFLPFFHAKMQIIHSF